MSLSTAAKPITIDEYLTNPAHERAEYVDGEVMEKNVGTGPHAYAQLNCGAILRQYFREKGGGKAFTELRCRLTVAGRTHFYQPDVAAILGSDLIDFRYLDRAPDLAVEIRSPDDRFHALFRKAEDYLSAGAKAVWLIEPDERCVYVLRRAAPLQVLASGETIEGGELLPGFQAAVDELFA